MKVVNGQHQIAASTTIGCRDGMSLRIVVRSTWVFVRSVDHNVGLLMWGDGSPLSSGQPGVGVAGAPPENGINAVSFHAIDSTAPAFTGVFGVQAFDTRVDLQWPGAVDGATGSWLHVYVVQRKKPDGTWMTLSHLWRPTFTETNLAPSTDYIYAVNAVDVHQNWSVTRQITMRTAQAGSRES
jgi:hypothetical protein